MDIKLLQLSDSHLHKQAGQRLIGVDTDASLRAVVELASKEEGVDAILATGDLSQDGSLQSYERFVDMVGTLERPIHWLPGNHDDVTYFHNPKDGFPLPARTTLDMATWRIIMLDSVVPGKDHGKLAQSELDYLADQLQSSDGRHCLVVLHHQPIATGADWLDTMQLYNDGAFMDVVQQYGSVRAVIYGHVHQDFSRDVDGIRFMSVPSTCFQFKPNSEGFALDDAFPGYRILVLKESGEIDTQVHRLAEFDLSLEEGVEGY